MVPAPADTAAPARWPDLRKRVLSAAILLPAAILAIALGGLPWAALVLAALLGLAWEWTRLCGENWAAWPGLLVPLAVLGAAGLGLAGLWWAGLALLGLAMLWLGRRAPWPAFGILYIGCAGLALLALRGEGAVGRGNVLFLLVIVWASDIGAYFAGRVFGGPKLAPAISPNKTWSGSLGGLLAAMAAGLAVAYGMGADGVSPGRSLLLAASLGVASQAGDLFESWIKRRYGVKDSSSLIPGHGGLLDRLDGVLAAAPLAAVVAALQGPGEALWQ